MSALLIILPFMLWAPFIGPGNYYSYTSTTATLALILVYISVGAAETVESWRERRPIWSAVCLLGPALLIWVLYRNIYPVPEFPNNLWPYLVLAWVAASWGLMKLRPALARTPLPDLS
jgi:MFS-type transporter involved in bile tolerance (Atg22 family)